MSDIVISGNSLVLGTTGSNQVAPFILLFVGFSQVCMLEQGVALTGVGMQPQGVARGVEVVLVLDSNIIIVNYGVYKAVRRVHGYG